MSIVSRVLSVVFAAGLLASCDQLTMLRNRDLAFAYTGDDTGAVERASVDSDTQVIASAKRVATRATTDPAVAEIDVDETHFVRGTLNVVYTGRIVFHCRTGEAWCQRVREAATSGSRPWPTRAITVISRSLFSKSWACAATSPSGRPSGWCAECDRCGVSRTTCLTSRTRVPHPPPLPHPFKEQ